MPYVSPAARAGSTSTMVKVVAIAWWGGIADGDAGAAEGRGSVLLLHPVGVAHTWHELMDKCLIGPNRSRDSLVPIVAYAKYPGIVASGYQRCSRRA